MSEPRYGPSPLEAALAAIHAADAFRAYATRLGYLGLAGTPARPEPLPDRIALPPAHAAGKTHRRPETGTIVSGWDCATEPAQTVCFHRTQHGHVVVDAGVEDWPRELDPAALRASLDRRWRDQLERLEAQIYAGAADDGVIEADYRVVEE